MSVKPEIAITVIISIVVGLMYWHLSQEGATRDAVHDSAPTAKRGFDVPVDYEDSTPSMQESAGGSLTNVHTRPESSEFVETYIRSKSNLGVETWSEAGMHALPPEVFDPGPPKTTNPEIEEEMFSISPKEFDPGPPHSDGPSGDSSYNVPPTF